MGAPRDERNLRLAGAQKAARARLDLSARREIIPNEVLMSGGLDDIGVALETVLGNVLLHIGMSLC